MSKHLPLSGNHLILNGKQMLNGKQTHLADKRAMRIALACGFNHARGFNRTRGFSLVELIVVIAIIGIMASIAVPSFNSSIASMRAKNAASTLYDGLVRARSEAVKRNVSVTLAPANTWAKGWQVYLTSNTSSVLESNGNTGTVTVTGPDSVEYKATGRATGSAQFNIQASMGSATSYRCVSVSLSGLPTIKTTSC